MFENILTHRSKTRSKKRREQAREYMATQNVADGAPLHIEFNIQRRHKTAQLVVWLTMCSLTFKVNFQLHTIISDSVVRETVNTKIKSVTWLCWLPLVCYGKLPVLKLTLFLCICLLFTCLIIISFSIHLKKLLLANGKSDQLTWVTRLLTCSVKKRVDLWRLSC